jgi:PAS domain S-box-containing protein
MSLDYGTVFEHIPIAICVSDQHTVELCNPAALHLFGYTNGALIGMPVTLLWSSLTSHKWLLERIFSVIKKNGCYTDVRALRLANGKVVWCRINATLYDASCDAPRYIWTFAEMKTTLKNVDELSPREQQIAVALVFGKSSRTIAQNVGLSVRTIEYYRERLMRRLGVANCKELIGHLTIGMSR